MDEHKTYVMGNHYSNFVDAVHWGIKNHKYLGALKALRKAERLTRHLRKRLEKHVLRGDK